MVVVVTLGRRRAQLRAACSGKVEAEPPKRAAHAPGSARLGDWVCRDKIRFHHVPTCAWMMLLKDVLQDEPAVVPDCIEFRILRQEFGGQLEGWVRKVMLMNLNHVSTDERRGGTSFGAHSSRHFILQLLVLLNLLPFLLACSFTSV